MIYDDIFTFLDNQLPEVGSRVYPTHMPPDPVLPFVVFSLDGGDLEEGTHPGSAYQNVEFEIHTTELAQMVAISKQLQAMLHRKKLVQVGETLVYFAKKASAPVDTAYYLEKEGFWIEVRTDTYTLKIDE